MSFAKTWSYKASVHPWNFTHAWNYKTYQPKKISNWDTAPEESLSKLHFDLPEIIAESPLQIIVNAAQKVADVIAQEAQETREFWDNAWIDISIFSWGEKIRVSVWDGVELIVSWSVGLDISEIERSLKK